MKRTLTALTLAVTTAIAAPAIAADVYSFEMVDGHILADGAIRTGEDLFRAVRQMDPNGAPAQLNFGGVPTFGQSGDENVGVIHQEGSNHSASLGQSGDGNSCGIFQYGTGTTAHVTQTGNERCALFQIGVD